MKSLILTILTIILTLSTTNCFAKISVDDLEINGIYLGQPISEVVNRFGQTHAVQCAPKGVSYIYRIGGKNKFTVTSSENKGGNVVGVGIYENCDFVTKAGIGVGSSLTDIKASYGEPDKIENHPNYNVINYIGSKGTDEYWLFFTLDKTSGVVEGFGFHGSSNISSSRPSSQTQTGPVSTIPKSVQEMPESEFYIGGITVGQTFDYVEQIYGKPGKIEDEGFFQTYNYNDRFIVKGKLNNGYKVCSVAIYEKGLATPSGFTGETPYAEVTKKYGAGHEMKFKAEGIEAKLKGCKDYTYFCNNKQMVFLVDKKGIIKAIRVEDRDDQKYIEARRKK